MRASDLFRRLGKVRLAKSCMGLEPLLAECQDFAYTVSNQVIEQANDASAINAELLEALKFVLENPMSERGIDKAKRVIAKAEGKG